MNSYQEASIYKNQISKQFYKVNSNFLPKWVDFLKIKSFDLDTKSIPKGFIPDFEESSKLKEQLYIGIIILISECQITFEQMLALTKKIQTKEPELKEGMKKFLKEEFYHSISYRHYLNYCTKLKWKGNSLVIEKKSRSRRLLYYWVKKYPKSLYLVGAKLEIFSLNYSILVTKTLEKGNSWRTLNEMHLEDEVHHIPFAMKIHNLFFKSSPLGLILKTYVMFILVQFLFLETSYRLVKRIYGEKGFFSQVALTMKLAKWIIRDFEAYKNTRKMLKTNMLKFKISKVFRLLAK